MQVKFIVPEPIDLNELDRELTKAFTNLVDKAEDLFGQSYSNWEPENKPEFQTQSKKDKDWEVEYSTDDNPYVWLDDGVEPHTIKAKNSSGFMTFKTPYKARTKPGSLTSGLSSFGNTWNRKQEVKHPGIEERDFSGQVEKKLPVSKEFDNAMIRVKSL